MNKQRDNIMNIEINKEFKKTYLVQESNTAKNMGSGDLEVFATPSLVAFMENAAKEYLNTFLPEELGSVGSNININHIAPTLVGKEITVQGKITEIIKEKIIIFSLEAYEQDKKIGDATHTRVIINNEKFLSKLK
jgi:Predicted thioesterase